MPIPDYIAELPICPETGLRLQQYESYSYDEWKPSLPEGWEVFDDRLEGHDPKEQKWYATNRVRRIGPRRNVLLAAAKAGGVTLIFAAPEGV